MKVQIVSPIRESTFRSMVAPWLAAIHKKDLIAVMSYPSSDRQRRLLNLLNQPKLIASLLPKGEEYLFITIDYRVDSISTPEQLESTLITRIQKELDDSTPKQPKYFADFLKTVQKRAGKTIVLAAIGCEKLTRENNTNLLIWSTIQQRLGILRQILFFETNLLDADHVRFFGNVPAFQPRISILKLYEKADVLQFIRHMEQEWDFSISTTMKESLYAQCGGMFLLVKEALWHLRDHPKSNLGKILSHTEMQFNLAALWQGFGPKEQVTLLTIAHYLPITDASLSQSLHYLMMTGFIAQKKNQMKITIPLLQSYIHQSMPKSYRFSLSGKSVSLNGTPIDANFSKNEREVLAKLIQAKNIIVKRYALADLLWPGHNGDYSDWALDSILSRMRKKLVDLGVPRDIVIVHKKKGIQLQNTHL